MRPLQFVADQIPQRPHLIQITGDLKIPIGPRAIIRYAFHLGVPRTRLPRHLTVTRPPIAVEGQTHRPHVNDQRLIERADQWFVRMSHNQHSWRRRNLLAKFSLSRFGVNARARALHRSMHDAHFRRGVPHTELKRPRGQRVQIGLHLLKRPKRIAMLLKAPPAARRVGRGMRQHVFLVIAQHALPAVRAHATQNQVQTLARARAAIDHVAAHDHALGLPPINVFDNRFQCGQISMNIR